MSNIDQNHVGEIWRRIEVVLRVHAPEVEKTIAPAATDSKVQKLEEAIGLHLPTDLKQSLMIHNGQHDPTRRYRFCGNMRLLSTTEIARDWKMLTDLGVDFDKHSGSYSLENNSLNGDWWRRSCAVHLARGGLSFTHIMTT